MLPLIPQHWDFLQNQAATFMILFPHSHSAQQRNIFLQVFHLTVVRYKQLLTCGARAKEWKLKQTRNRSYSLFLNRLSFFIIRKVLRAQRKTQRPSPKLIPMCACDTAGFMWYRSIVALRRGICASSIQIMKASSFRCPRQRLQSALDQPMKSSARSEG